MHASKQLGNWSTNATRLMASSRGTFREKRKSMLSSKKWLLNNTRTKNSRMRGSDWQTRSKMGCFVTAERKCWRLSYGEPSSTGYFAAVIQSLGANRETWGFAMPGLESSTTFLWMVGEPSISIAPNRLSFPIIHLRS
jgi:hypothetical protein